MSTYNALLDVCARSGDIGRAEPLLKDMADQGSDGTCGRGTVNRKRFAEWAPSSRCYVPSSAICKQAAVP